MVTRIALKAGEVIEATLPSGAVINVEVTADTADVVCGDDVLYSEELVLDGSGKWEKCWPEYANGLNA